MIQDEVDLIYNYLHEHYEYRDGELFNKKTKKQVGSIVVKEGDIHCSFSVRLNGVNYNFIMQKLIYFMFYKKIPKYIDFIDGNKMNFKIENLMEIKSRRSPGINSNSKYICKMKYGFQSYICQEGRKHHIGLYDIEEKAIMVSLYGIEKLKTMPVKEAIEICQKKFPTKTNSSRKCLPKGVYKNIKTFYSQIMIKGKKISLGTFSCPEEAHSAYLKAKKELTSS